MYLFSLLYQKAVEQNKNRWSKSKASLCRLKMELCPMSFSVSLFSGNAKPDGHYFLMSHGCVHKEVRNPCEPHDHCYLIGPSAIFWVSMLCVLDGYLVTLD